MNFYWVKWTMLKRLPKKIHSSSKRLEIFLNVFYLLFHPFFFLFWSLFLVALFFRSVNFKSEILSGIFFFFCDYYFNTMKWCFLLYIYFIPPPNILTLSPPISTNLYRASKIGLFRSLQSNALFFFNSFGAKSMPPSWGDQVFVSDKRERERKKRETCLIRSPIMK